MNRRSFLASVLGALASVPVLGRLVPDEPIADTLGEDDIHYAYAHYRDCDYASGSDCAVWTIYRSDGTTVVLRNGQSLVYRGGRWEAEPA